MNKLIKTILGVILLSLIGCTKENDAQKIQGVYYITDSYTIRMVGSIQESHKNDYGTIEIIATSHNQVDIYGYFGYLKATIRNNALKIDTISETTDDGYYIKQTFSNGRIQKDKISFSYETFITNNKAAMTINGNVECIKRE